MDSIMPERRLEVLQEKIDAWRETEAKAIERYCSLIEVMTDVADNIDGHPAEAVRMLSQVRVDLERMDQRMVSGNIGEHVDRKDDAGLLRTIGIVLSWIVSTGIGVIVGLAVAGR